MERWQNRVAVVTGASSGIGQEIAKDLVSAGLRVVALGRRLERLEQNRSEIPQKFQKNYYVKQCDVSKEEDVIATFEWIEKTLGGTDILVNNAGVGKFGDTLDVDTSIIHQVIDTNVKGVVFCSREAFKSMNKRKFDGHLIHINSVAGHQVVQSTQAEVPGFNVYSATKFAVTAMNEVIRNELRNKGTKIKTTSLSPGVVKTEFAPEDLYEVFPSLKAEDISQAVLFVLGTPPHVQIHELTIKPVGELF